MIPLGIYARTSAGPTALLLGATHVCFQNFGREKINIPKGLVLRYLVVEGENATFCEEHEQGREVIYLALGRMMARDRGKLLSCKREEGGAWG